MMDPKIFLAPWVPLNTNFEGGGGAEKTQLFWSIFFQKVHKNAILCLFFQKFAMAQKVSVVLWECSENQFGRPKKKGRLNFLNFLKIRLVVM